MPLSAETIHPRLEGFKGVYNIEVLPLLKRHEPERKLRVMLGIGLGIVSVPLVSLLCWYLLVTSEDADIRIFGLVILGPIVAYVLTIQSLRVRIKQTFLESILGHLNWDHVKNLDLSRLFERLHLFNLMPDYTKIKVGDVICGEHMEWPFQISEVRLLKITGFGRSTRTKTVFAGYVLSFPLSIRPEIVTVLNHSSPSGATEQSSGLTFYAEYSDNEGDMLANYSEESSQQTLLCQRFKQVLEEIRLNTEKVIESCIFDHEHLHVIVTRNDMFEMDLMFKSLEDHGRAKKIVSEISDILVLLDIILKKREGDADLSFDYPEFRKKEKGVEITR